MSEQWTLQREHVLKDIISELNDMIRTREAELAALHDVIESQQAELDAAREVVEAARNFIPPLTIPANETQKYIKPEWKRWLDAIDAYDAARAKQEES